MPVDVLSCYDVGMDEAINPRWATLRDLPDRPEVSVFPDREPRIRHQDVGATHEFRCPKCKYDLTGIPNAYCPECGLTVAYEPVTVFTAADLSLVWAAALELDHAEISNLIVTGNSDPIAGIITRRHGMPHVLVPFKFFHEAVDLLEERFGRREFPPGEKPPRPESPPGWTCPACHERNPGTFEVCWQCGADNPPVSPDNLSGRND